MNESLLLPACIQWTTHYLSGMQRFYALQLEPKLFGEWCLLRVWGRIGRGGQNHAPKRGSVECEY